MPYSSDDFDQACGETLGAAQKEFKNIAKALNEVSRLSGGGMPDFMAYAIAHDFLFSAKANGPENEGLNNFAYVEYYVGACRKLVQVFREQAHALTENLPENHATARAVKTTQKKIDLAQAQLTRFAMAHSSAVVQAKQTERFLAGKAVIDDVKAVMAATIATGNWEPVYRPHPNPGTGVPDEYLYSSHMRKLAEIAPQLRALGFGS